MTNEQNENGWDSLADELGIAPTQPTEPAAKPSGTPRPEPSRPAPARPARDLRPEIEQEAEDFGAGLSEGPEPAREAALYDPGAGVIAEDAEEYEDVATESYEDAEEGFEPPVSGEEAGEGQEGGKRRRRRRRRKKKGGGEAADSAAAPEAAESDNVEEGEAPAEVEGDEEEESTAPLPAMEEELEEEAVQAPPEWHVMTWAELVSKLYRPG